MPALIGRWNDSQRPITNQEEIADRSLPKPLMWCLLQAWGGGEGRGREEEGEEGRKRRGREEEVIIFFRG